jgi:hypothetical protein
MIFPKFIATITIKILTIKLSHHFPLEKFINRFKQNKKMFKIIKKIK